MDRQSSWLGDSGAEIIGAKTQAKPKIDTLNSKPQITKPKPQTPDPKPQT